MVTVRWTGELADDRGQLGLVAGVLVTAFTNRADRIAPVRLFAIGAALANLLVVAADGFSWLSLRGSSLGLFLQSFTRRRSKRWPHGFEQDAAWRSG